MVERRNQSSMHAGRFEKRLSLGGDIHLLGECSYDPDEEEKKEIDEMRMVQEMTQSINEIQGQIE